MKDYLIEQEQREYESKCFQNFLKVVVPKVANREIGRVEAISCAKEKFSELQSELNIDEFHPSNDFLRNSKYNSNNAQHRAVLMALYEELDDYNDAELEY